MAAGGKPDDQLPATGFQQFLCGLAAGTLAKLSTHPLDVCKKRFQVLCAARSGAHLSSRFKCPTMGKIVS